MTRDIDTLHHIGILSRDLEATVARYETLGFQFTPPSLPQFPLTPGGPPQTVGVANRNAIFENGFLEMLGVVDAERWASITAEQRGPFDIDRPLRRYEGLHVVHFGAEDLDAVHGRLTRAGLQPSPIRPFQRLVDTEHGPQMMRARSVAFAPDANPEALLQIAQHETPEVALQPRFMRHPNGARALSAVIVCTPQPAQIAAKYARYTGHPVRVEDRRLTLDLGRARVEVVHPDDLGALLPGETPPTAPWLAGFAVTADLDRAREWLRGQGVAFDIAERRVLIRSKDACGAAVIFEPPAPARQG